MGLFAKPGEWMQLNADYRRSTPKDKNGQFVPHCCRCQKPIKGSAGLSFKVVEVDEIGARVRSNPLGKDIIGEDCWKRVLEENKIEI
jgi:hypothetical protein